MLDFTRYPKFKGKSSTGQPLSGGLLYVYAAGTTDKISTYPSCAEMLKEQNARTDPIELDSNGECFVTVSEPAKLVLKDRDGNTIWTQDNVEPNTTLLDANGEPILKLTGTLSSVNYIEVSNATTGAGPAIEAIGTDLDIDLNLSGKGTGKVVFNNFGGASVTGVPGTASASGKIQVAEQTTNGTNYIEFTAPTSLSATYGYTLPIFSSTSTILTTNSSGALTWLGSGTSGYLLQTNGSASVNWVNAEATQAELETGTSTTKFSSAAKQMYHTSAAKFWIKCNFSGTALASYNVSSISDTATGRVTISLSTNFSTADYAVEVNAGHSLCRFASAASVTSSSFEIDSFDDTNTLADPNFYTAVSLGDRP